ncbi:MAG: hemolysin III family protein [Actinobacteria bacterium]|nr:hemolysin III family protein [Actinomycetota bacterium]
MKRTKLADRPMPGYSPGEELCHVVSHIAGAVLGVVALIWCLILADSPVEIIASIVYAMTMILLYTTSSIYHGLKHPTAKKVFQVLDHCTIYLFIAGTYTIIALGALRPEYPALAWAAVAFQWTVAAIAVTLTAIDLKRYEHFSFACYIVMGWSALVAVKPTVRVLGWAGSGLLLAGGISYTIGAILYVIGRKKQYAHSVFHVFVLLGSLLHFLCVVLFVL